MYQVKHLLWMISTCIINQSWNGLARRERISLIARVGSKDPEPVILPKPLPTQDRSKHDEPTKNEIQKDPTLYRSTKVMLLQTSKI